MHKSIISVAIESMTDRLPKGVPAISFEDFTVAFETHTDAFRNIALLSADIARTLDIVDGLSDLETMAGVAPLESPTEIALVERAAVMVTIGTDTNPEDIMRKITVAQEGFLDIFNKKKADRKRPKLLTLREILKISQEQFADQNKSLKENSEADIKKVEDHLGVELPEDLVMFYKATDGIKFGDHAIFTLSQMVNAQKDHEDKKHLKDWLVISDIPSGQDDLANGYGVISIKNGDIGFSYDGLDEITAGYDNLCQYLSGLIQAASKSSVATEDTDVRIPVSAEEPVTDVPTGADAALPVTQAQADAVTNPDVDVTATPDIDTGASASTVGPVVGDVPETSDGGAAAEPEMTLEKAHQVLGVAEEAYRHYAGRRVSQEGLRQLGGNLLVAAKNGILKLLEYLKKFFSSIGKTLSIDKLAATLKSELYLKPTTLKVNEVIYCGDQPVLNADDLGKRYRELMAMLAGVLFLLNKSKEPLANKLSFKDNEKIASAKKDLENVIFKANNGKYIDCLIFDHDLTSERHSVDGNDTALNFKGGHVSGQTVELRLQEQIEGDLKGLSDWSDKTSSILMKNLEDQKDDVEQDRKDGHEDTVEVYRALNELISLSVHALSASFSSLRRTNNKVLNILNASAVNA